MIITVKDSAPFQILTSAMVIGPSQTGYQLEVAADGRNFSPLFSVGPNVTRQATNLSSGAYYRLNGNVGDVVVNWNRSCVTEGGADSTELTPIDYFPLAADPGTVVAYSGSASATGVYQYDGSEWVPVGSDEKTLVDFDHTSQAERASLYAELKALYDAGSGATINRNYDFYKTVNTWQGLKIDYYGFSGDTLVFGKVVSPENLDDQVVYEQVVAIDSAGNVNVVTNVVGGSPDLSAYWTSAETKTYVDTAVSGIDLSNYYTKSETNSAITAVENHLFDVEEVTASALTELHDAVLELSGSSVDLSGYYTSGETDAAISAATAGKADAANVTANTNKFYFPKWNSQGVINGINGGEFYLRSIKINGTDKTFPCYDQLGGLPAIYAPTTSGNPGEVLVADGTTPKWSAMPAADVTKAYVDSADTALQDQIDTMDDVVSAALVDLNTRKVESTSVSTIWKGTQAEYDAATQSGATADPATLYIIVNNS